MNAPTPTTEARDSALSRSIGFHGRVAVLSAMAGGVAVGGVLVAAMTLSGQLSGHALFLNASALFIVGTLLGLVHGVALAYFGRPLHVKPRAAFRDLGLATLYAVPGVAVAWLVAVWVAMSVVAAYTGGIGPMLGVTLGWLAAAAILVTFAIHAWRALGNAYARWPERRAGTVLVAASLAAFMVIFLADRPEIWGLRLRLTQTGAVLLAGLATVWVAGPMITLALRLVQRLPSLPRRAGLVRGSWTARDLVIGLAVGAVTGLLAVPFAAPGAGAGVVAEISEAVVNEIFLLLFLVTSVAWILLRTQRLHAQEAAVGAILVATVTQVLIYTPGALAVGWATWTGLVAFLAAAVAVPALAFGLLYWRRGFGTALVADATAVIALALLA